MKKKMRWTAALLLLALMNLTVFAAKVNKTGGSVAARPAQGLVADLSGALDPVTVQQLNSRGAATERRTGATVALIVIDLPGAQTIDSYVNQVFDQWEIEDGLVLAMTIGDENYYAMPSAGLGRYLTDGDIDAMLQEYLEPDFARRDYDAGAQKIYEAFCDKIEELYELYGEKDANTSQSSSSNQPAQPAQPKPQETKSAQRSSGGGRFNFMSILVLAIIVYGR